MAHQQGKPCRDMVSCNCLVVRQPRQLGGVAKDRRATLAFEKSWAEINGFSYERCRRLEYLVRIPRNTDDSIPLLHVLSYIQFREFSLNPCCEFGLVEKLFNMRQPQNLFSIQQCPPVFFLSHDP